MAELRKLLLAAKVQDCMVESFMDDRLESVRDFLNLFSPGKATAGQEIKKHVEGKFPVQAGSPARPATDTTPLVPEVKEFTLPEQNLIVSRVRAAWQDATKAEANAEKAETAPPDVEAPTCQKLFG